MQGDRRRFARVDTPQPHANCGGGWCAVSSFGRGKGPYQNKPAADVSFGSRTAVPMAALIMRAVARPDQTGSDEAA